jgi:hypothetical protein
MMPKGSSKDDACERTALDALQLLQHDHDLNILDCNWSEALEIRARCAILVDQFVAIRNIHGLVHSKCLMVMEGIGFTSDVLLNKAYEIEKKAAKDIGQVDMEKVYRDCANQLQLLSERSTGEVQWQYGFTQTLQSSYRSKLPRPYIDYTRLLLKVSIFHHVIYILYKNNCRYIYAVFICC